MTPHQDVQQKNHHGEHEHMLSKIREEDKVRFRIVTPVDVSKTGKRLFGIYLFIKAEQIPATLVFMF